MLEHEHNLFIALCLGKELTGDESPEELNAILEVENAAAIEQPVRRQQEELGDWLNTSLSHCHNRQDAATRLWAVIGERGYSLADVPVKLRRKIFGGSLSIQKRLAKRPLHQRLLRSLLGVLQPLIGIAVVGGVAWWLWKRFAD